MITVLSGANRYTLSKKQKELKQDFIKNHGEAGLESYNADQIQPGQLASLLTGATLFAENRYIVIKELSQNKLLSEQLLNIINNIPDEVQVVLIEPQLDKRTVFYKTLKKKAELLEFGEPDEYTLVSWVQDVVKQLEGTIDQKSARLLVQYTGLDQSRLQNEIEKLIAFDKAISINSITELVDKNPQDTIFQLLEFALSGQTKKALDVLDGLERAHEDPFQTASMLIWQTNILAVVHSAGTISDADIAKSAKINPFVVRKTRSLASSMSKTELNHILNAVADCDIQLKSTSAEPWRVVEQAILSL